MRRSTATNEGEPAVENERGPIGVLIVDDHSGYRQIAAEVVEAAEGFEMIAVASDREQALQRFAECRAEISLILMDVNLGTEDGLRLTCEITSGPDAPEVVLVTALQLEDLPSAARSCGARGFLPKAQLSPSALSGVRAGVYDWGDGSFESRSGR